MPWWSLSAPPAGWSEGRRQVLRLPQEFLHAWSPLLAQVCDSHSQSKLLTHPAPCKPLLEGALGRALSSGRRSSPLHWDEEKRDVQEQTKTWACISRSPGPQGKEETVQIWIIKRKGNKQIKPSSIGISSFSFMWIKKKQERKEKEQAQWIYPLPKAAKP